MDLGGGTKYRNDVLLDGTPLTAGNKLGYTPPMDAVSEYTIAAELGGRRVRPQRGRHRDRDHEVGHQRRQGLGLLLRPRRQPQRDQRPGDPAGTTTTPTGTPGRRSASRSRRTSSSCSPSSTRSTTTQSQASNYSLPTALERQGDFSQSYNANGTLRVIYDPLTSRTVNGVQVRDPFPGNKIPANRWDPVAAQILAGLWQPNNAGDDLTGFNNFKSQDERTFHYLNFSTRLDWNIIGPLEGLRARQPHEDGPGRRSTTRRERPAEAAQHHRVEAQRLEHRRRHRLHLQPLDDAQRPRVLLPGRGQARVPRHGRGRGGLREPVAERLVAAVRRGPAAHLLALPRRGEHRAEPSSGSRTSGTSSPRATASTRGSTSTSPSTRSRSAPRSAGSAATRRASSSPTCASWRPGRPTGGRARPRPPGTPGRASCSEPWTPAPRTCSTGSCRSPTPRCTASTSRTTGRSPRRSRSTWGCATSTRAASGTPSTGSRSSST